MTAVAAPARADMLPQAECQRLSTERQSLVVLGIDKHVEKGPDWAKANLTVADLDLVKRYFEIFEQLKFRCEEDIGIVEVDEPDTEDKDDQQTAAPGSAPPKPERREKPLSHSSAAAVPEFTGSTTAKEPKAKEPRMIETRTIGSSTIVTKSIDTAPGSNTTTITKRPRQVAPVQ